MKFQIKSKDLVEAKDKIKRVVLNSSLVKKSIYLSAKENEVIMYAQSEGNYGEIHIPCIVQEEGFVELMWVSFDVFNESDGDITFELKETHLHYKPRPKGKLNVISTEPDFKETDKPTEWITLPKVVFDVLYCNTKDDLNLENIFFAGDKIATTSRIAFAGYKHLTELTNIDFTVAPSVFDIIPKGNDFQVAFDLRKIWFKVDEFYIGASTVDYSNPIVTKYGYYEYEGDYPFFEITLEEARRLCDYTASLSDNGYAALLLKDNQLTVIPNGNEIGEGSIEFECRSSQGEINFGTNTRNLLNAVSHVDAATCKVYNIVDGSIGCLLVKGHLTRHLFSEIPSARYNAN